MISIVLFIIAGFFNAIMDVLKTRYNVSVFKKMKFQEWINPALAMNNKWKHRNIKYGERFFGSSTFLVWTTDMWHFSKMLMIIFMSLGVIYYTPIFGFLDFFIFVLAFTITFEISFKYFLIKRN